MGVRILEVADVMIGIRTHDEPSDSAASMVFGALPVGRGTPVVMIDIGCGLLPDPIGSPQAVGQFHRWRERGRLRLSVGDVAAEIHRDSVIVRGPSHLLEGGLRALRLGILAHLLSPAGRYVVHAATLVNSRHSVLVLGPSGSGKSTIALAGRHRGWLAVSDDISVLRERTSRIEVAGAGFPLHAPDDLGSTLAQQSPLVARDPRSRREIPADSMEWRPVTDVILSTHGASRATGIEPLSPRTTLVSVLGSFYPFAEPDARARFFDIATALCKTRTWCLSHGNDVTRRIAGAGDALDIVRAD